MTFEQIVEMYIRLRDKKKEKDDAHKAAMETINDALKSAEATLLAAFQANGMESVNTKFGTAYKSVRSSAKVEDWDRTLAFILSGGHFEMLEKRVAKTAVEAYRDEHNILPPGIGWSEELTVNVRRS